MKSSLKGQIIDLPEQLDSIPREVYNAKFVDVLNKEFTTLTTHKNDSVVLLYILQDFYVTDNYAIIFCKNKRQSRAFVFWQKEFPNGDVKKKEIINDTITSININHLYWVFQSKEIRTDDTLVNTSHENMILCQFYFRELKPLKVGYISKVLNRLDPDFRRSFLYESLRNR